MDHFAPVFLRHIPFANGDQTTEPRVGAPAWANIIEEIIPVFGLAKIAIRCEPCVHKNPGIFSCITVGWYAVSPEPRGLSIKLQFKGGHHGEQVQADIGDVGVIADVGGFYAGGLGGKAHRIHRQNVFPVDQGGQPGPAIPGSVADEFAA